METSSNGHANFEFESQFEKKGWLLLPEGRIEVVDVVPPKYQLDPTPDLPVLVGPGWSESAVTYKKTMKALFDENRRALSVNFSRIGGKVEHEPEYPNIEFRKALQVLGVLAAQGIEQADTILHSEAAMYGLIAAAIDPNSFRYIVLDRPAGLIGHDTELRLLGRFGNLLRQEVKERKGLPKTDPTNRNAAALGTFRFSAKNPFRTKSELSVLAYYDIYDLIEYVEDLGPRVVIIGGPDDPLFPAQRQIEHFRQKKRQTGKNPPIEGYVSVKGGHNMLSIKADQYTPLAMDLLKGMARRSEREIG